MGETVRTNGFGEKYCHTADEAHAVIAAWGKPVYVPDVWNEPVAEGEQWTAEIADNVDGDLVCYIEAPTVEAARAIVDELGIEVA